MKIAILFTYPKRPTIIARIICFAMRTPFDHVCLEIDNLIYGRAMVFQAAETTVQLITYDKLLLNHNIISRHELIIDEKRFLKMISFLTNELGNFYSFFGLLGMGLKSLLHCKNPFKDGKKTMFCSEYIGGALIEGKLIEVDPEEVNPRDLFEVLNGKNEF